MIVTRYAVNQHNLAYEWDSNSGLWLSFGVSNLGSQGPSGLKTVEAHSFDAGTQPWKLPTEELATLEVVRQPWRRHT